MVRIVRRLGMVRAFVLLLSLAMVLTACGGTPTPLAQPTVSSEITGLILATTTST